MESSRELLATEWMQLDQREAALRDAQKILKKHLDELMQTEMESVSQFLNDRLKDPGKRYIILQIIMQLSKSIMQMIFPTLVNIAIYSVRDIVQARQILLWMDYNDHVWVETHLLPLIEPILTNTNEDDTFLRVVELLLVLGSDRIHFALDIAQTHQNPDIRDIVNYSWDADTRSKLMGIISLPKTFVYPRSRSENNSL